MFLPLTAKLHTCKSSTLLPELSNLWGNMKTGEAVQEQITTSCRHTNVIDNLDEKMFKDNAINHGKEQVDADGGGSKQQSRYVISISI